jgi:hypothetical protein
LSCISEPELASSFASSSSSFASSFASSCHCEKGHAQYEIVGSEEVIGTAT